MNSFAYTRVSDVRSAVHAVSAQPDAVFIAGGTNLIDLMKESVSRPSHLVDITRVPLNRIEELADGGLRLGALVTNADTAYNAEVERRYPMLSRAILAGASAQLRNMATNGGNLLQRTRCYYFYDTATPCNKRDPGAGCSAIDGFNRIHAILGTSEQCIAVHPSDMCVALLALDAVVRVTGKDGDRAIPFADLHRLPGETPQVDTNLRRGEIITSIDLPRQGFADHYAYLKVRDRTSYAFALVSVAAALEMDGDTITETRLALGGVAHKPWRNADAEAMLNGITATKDHFDAVGEAIVRGAKGFGHNTFKIDLARRAVVRALQHAARMTRSERSA
jgi:xanthine dehydrogenase YagS FAD-binding subunit